MSSWNPFVSRWRVWRWVGNPSCHASACAISWHPLILQRPASPKTLWMTLCATRWRWWPANSWGSTPSIGGVDFWEWGAVWRDCMCWFVCMTVEKNRTIDMNILISRTWMSLDEGCNSHHWNLILALPRKWYPAKTLNHTCWNRTSTRTLPISFHEIIMTLLAEFRYPTW